MAQPTQFIITRDINATPDYGLGFTTFNYNTTLATDVEQMITLPANPSAQYTYWKINFYFSPGSNVYVALNATATVPGASFAQSDSEPNPGVRYARPGDVLHFITPDASGAYANFSIRESQGE